MRNIIIPTFVVLVGGLLSLIADEATAGTYCKTSNECRSQVASLVRGQDKNAAGRQWGPVSRSACAIASREQEGNARRCRSYDEKPGGKTLAECAKCYRQVREDLARWEQCYREGFAPKPSAKTYESLAILGRNMQKLK